MIVIELPYPPTVNHYWGRRGKRTFITKKGDDFRRDVIIKCMQEKKQLVLSGRLDVEVLLFVPDRRKRDIDNITKSLLDSLSHAHVWEDDEQIDVLTIRRMERIKGGKCIVKIKEVESEREGN